MSPIVSPLSMQHDLHLPSLVRIMIFIFPLLVLLAPAVHAEQVLYETNWIAGEEMSPVLQRMNKNNLFPCRIDGRMSGSGKTYKAFYCGFLPGQKYFYSRWGLSDSDHARYNAFYAEQKMTPHFHTTFTDDEGSTWHQSTWVLMNDERRDRDSPDGGHESTQRSN